MKARLHGVLFSVHGDICFWGQSATSKRVNDVGTLSGVCWPKLPGLVGTIVLAVRDPAAATKPHQRAFT